MSDVTNTIRPPVINCECRINYSSRSNGFTDLRMHEGSFFCIRLIYCRAFSDICIIICQRTPKCHVKSKTGTLMRRFAEITLRSLLKDVVPDSS